MLRAIPTLMLLVALPVEWGDLADCGSEYRELGWLFIAITAIDFTTCNTTSPQLHVVGVFSVQAEAGPAKHVLMFAVCVLCPDSLRFRVVLLIYRYRRFELWTIKEVELATAKVRPRLSIQPGQVLGAHVRLFSLWIALSVRILTDVNVGSDLIILLRRHCHL